VKVALYARVSTSEGDEKQDPENQLIRLRDFAKLHGWEIYKEYIDYASGAAPVREQLSEMLKDASAHRIHAILIVRIDRIMRSLTHLLNLMGDLKHYGVELICSDQNIDTSSPEGRYFLSNLGAFAEYEREVIAMRTKEGLRRAKLQGKRLGKPPNTALTDRILELRSQGLSPKQIGEQLEPKLSRAAVKQRIRRGRIQRRKENKT